MPALLLTQVRFLTPESRTAAISLSGTPTSPKPPHISIMPSASTPSSADFASLKTLFAIAPSSSSNASPPDGAEGTEASPYGDGGSRATETLRRFLAVVAVQLGAEHAADVVEFRAGDVAGPLQ